MSKTHNPVTMCGVTEAGDPKAIMASEDGEAWITDKEREGNVSVLLSTTVSTAQTYWYGLVDLSDTTNWPHDISTNIHISDIYFHVDKVATAFGEFSIGVITRVDGTDADVSFVYVSSFTQNDTLSSVEIINLSPSQIKLNVESGAMSKFKTTKVDLAVSAINTGGGDLSFGSDTFTPAVGDLVAKLVKTGQGDMTITASVTYHMDD